MSDPAIAVFAKAPVPGHAKTRLGPLLGPQGAARLQAKLTRRAVATAVAARLGPVRLHCAPGTGHASFERLSRDFAVGLVPQQGADLGARMAHAFAASGEPLILIGADCPALTPDHLRGVAARLAAGDDAVFLPAEDGGYVLVALARPCPGLFAGMAWGTAAIMRETRARLAAFGLVWSEPLTLWDVDRPEDYYRMLAEAPLD